MADRHLPTNCAEHDRYVSELIQTHSLDALSYLITAGRELEFHCCGAPCFLTRDNSGQFVSLWCQSQEQSFESMEALISQATIHGIPIVTAWQDTVLDCLL